MATFACANTRTVVAARGSTSQGAVRGNAVTRSRPGGKKHPGRVRDLDVDRERRNARAAIHAYLNAVALHRHVLRDGGQDLFAQNGKQIGLSARYTLIGQKDLKPFSADRGAAPAPKQFEEAHAALSPNSLSNKPLRSLGMAIGTSSPLSLRAASRYARAGALAALLSVTGEPTLEARSTSSLSGMMPSSGVERISSTSSMDSISPRAARAGSKRVIRRCLSTRSPFSARRVLESSMPMMRSESRTEDTSGLVTMTAASAKRIASVAPRSMPAGLSQITQSNFSFSSAIT